MFRKGTQVEWRYTEQGEKVRVSKRTGHIIPIPVSATETIDYKTKAGYPGMHLIIPQNTECSYYNINKISIQKEEKKERTKKKDIQLFTLAFFLVKIAHPASMTSILNNKAYIRICFLVIYICTDFFLFVEQEKDTRANDVAEVTYVPKLRTFEMDLMEHYRLE